MVRGGEMMVIIRAQDYASRTVHKVAGELAGMQRQQRIQMRAQAKYLPALRQEAAMMGKVAAQHRVIANAMAASGNATYGWTKAGKAQGAVLTDLNQKLSKVRQGLATLPASMQSMRGMSSSIESFATSVAKLNAERLHRVGAAMSGIGRTMQLFGAVGTLGFGLAANAFGKFSASAATAGTQMRDLNAPMAQAVARSKELQTAILSMAQVFPNSAQDMTDAAYEIFSSMNLMHNGVMNVNAGLKLLAVANKAAVAGGVDLKEATNAMIVALNIFDPQLKNVQGTMDDVFNIVRFGRIRLDDLSHVFTQFASAAHAGGMSLKEVGSAFATLTLFNDPGKASAGLGRLIELLRTPDFRQGLDKLTGVKVIAPDTGKFRPLLNIFQEIVKARPDLAASRKAAIDFFIELTKASGLTKKGIQGTVQARRAFETLATHMDTFADTTKNVNRNYNEMDKSFRARMGDPGVQWELFKNRLKALALVIGQQVLPVFLRIGEWIAHAIQWFQGINGGTRGAIIRFAAWASVGMLLAGVLLSVAGSVVQLTATIALLGIAARTAGAEFSLMRAIMITTGWGAIIVGAGVAAVLVMKHWDQVRAYFKAWHEDVGASFKHFWYQVWKGAELTGLDIVRLFGKISEKFGGQNPFGDWAANAEKNIGNELKNRSDRFLDLYNKYVKMYRKQRGKGGIDWMKDYKRIVGKFDLGKLSKQYKDYLNTVNDTTGSAAQTMKDHAEAVKQATDNMNQTVKTATTNLINIYEQLQQANEAGLGGLFQGPTMSGILGNVFKNINDNLRQFGVQIPVPFNILKQDLDQSLTYFKRWRQDLNKLMKRGVPYEMIQELQAMGPEGIPILEGLLGGSKGQIRSVIKAYKQGQKLTDKATQDDMKRKLKYWNSFGKDAAYAMIMGIINNPKNFKLQKMYENYVKNTYGAILKKTFQDDVAEYMKNAIANAKAQAASANIGASFPKGIFAPGSGGGGKGGAAPPNVYTINKRIAESNRLQTLYARAATTSPYFAEKLAAAQREEKRLRAQRRNLVTQERQTIKQQLITQQRKHPNWDYVNVTYGGDTITVHADGATPAAVTRAMQKLAYKHKHKHKKGTTVKNP